MKPYILNVVGQVAHVRAHLSESCNTDQIVKRRDSDSVPKSYRLCERCGPASLREKLSNLPRGISRTPEEDLRLK